MSIRRRLLNLWLRTVEKRRMRTGSVAQLRRALDLQARLFFHAPRGTKSSWSKYGGIPCLEMTPFATDPSQVLFYIHGGGFVFGSPNTHGAMAANLAQRFGARAVLPRYRLAPEAPFPAAPQDVRAAWDGLLASGVAARNVVIGGDSAGGALAFGLIATLNAEGADMPCAVFGLSPLTDLTFSGASFAKNVQSDVVLPAERAAELGELFLRGQSGDLPSVSPLFGDFKGGPPAWITVGNSEILLDDARSLSARLQAQGADTTLVVTNDLPHVWPIFHNILPEGRQTLETLAAWIKQHFPESSADS